MFQTVAHNTRLEVHPIVKSHLHIDAGVCAFLQLKSLCLVFSEQVSNLLLKTFRVHYQSNSSYVVAKKGDNNRLASLSYSYMENVIDLLVFLFHRNFINGTTACKFITNLGQAFHVNFFYNEYFTYV